MESDDDTRAEVYDLVRTYLAELFDDGDVHEEDNGHFYVRYGSTVLEISVEPYGPEEMMVMVMAYCVQDVEADEDLLRGLLEVNHSLPFGSFSLVGNDIFFHHALFGRSLERRALLNALAAVATISDDYDDRIVDKFGGQRALDRIRSTGGRQRRKERGAAVDH
jgi:T3SS (YopN, CesT) and YbjN peptide-binding chaperone 1